MIANEYLNREHHKDLQREAEQQRLADEAHPRRVVSPVQRAGRAMLALGARFGVADAEMCYTVQTREQVVTVCPAAC